MSPSQWSIIAALQTGLTNARTEGYNRIVKHVGRIAFGSATPTTNLSLDILLSLDPPMH